MPILMMRLIPEHFVLFFIPIGNHANQLCIDFSCSILLFINIHLTNSHRFHPPILPLHSYSNIRPYMPLVMILTDPVNFLLFYTHLGTDANQLCIAYSCILLFFINIHLTKLHLFHPPIFSPKSIPIYLYIAASDDDPDLF